MSILHRVVVCSLALLLGALLMPASPASAHCTPYHPHHCLDDIEETINPSTPSSDQIYEFTLINKSSETVYVAYGKYRPYSSNTNGLAFITPAAWVAQGWWSVAPGARQIIYRSYSDDHIYFRIENRFGDLAPRSHEGSAQFCTSSYAFYSTEMEKQYPGSNNNFAMSINNGARTTGVTCSQVGGEWDTFYKMRAHMDFTVN